MSQQPTMDDVVEKLEQEAAPFTLDEVKVLTDEIERMEGELQATRRRAEAAEEDWQAAETELGKFHKCKGGICLEEEGRTHYSGGALLYANDTKIGDEPCKVYHKDGE